MMTHAIAARRAVAAVIAVATLAAGTANAADTYRLTTSTLLPTGRITLGQAELAGVWNASFSVIVPRERRQWAIAVAHASQLFRNVTRVTDAHVGPNHYIATAIQETRLGADPASAKFTYRFAAPNPIYYVPGAAGDGFMQVAETTAFAELKAMFPARFGTRSHAALVSGAKFATSMLTAAYYNIFAYQFFVGSGWKPAAFAKAAEDPQALERALAYGYNRGVWNDAMAAVFTTRRAKCLKLASMADAGGTCYPNTGDEGSLYVRQVPGFDLALVAAAKKPLGFPGVYDMPIRWIDVDDYLTAIAPLYKAAEIARARTAAKTAYDDTASGRASIHFRAEFGTVLDAILLALPVDTAKARLCSEYGKCAVE